MYSIFQYTEKSPKMTKIRQMLIKNYFLLILEDLLLRSEFFSLDL